MNVLLSVGFGGVLFGLGLAWSGMARPEVVLSFLQLRDLGLLLVMASGVAVTALTFNLAPRLWRHTLLGRPFVTACKTLHRGTIPGAVIFGLGWGISGVCPGAAIASVGIGNGPILIALAGMFLGAYLQGIQARRPSPR